MGTYGLLTISVYRSALYILACINTSCYQYELFLQYAPGNLNPINTDGTQETNT